jgi:hypothetical protein
MNTSRSSCKKRLDCELDLLFKNRPHHLEQTNTLSGFFEYHSNDFVQGLDQWNSFFILKRSVRSPSAVNLPFMKAV